MQFSLGKTFWWMDPNPNEGVFATVEYLLQNQHHRQDAMLRYLRLYSNRAASSMSSESYMMSDSDQKMKLNIIKSIIDTATAVIATRRTKPDFLTVDGTHSDRVKAKNLGRFTMGQFQQLKAYRIGTRVFKDACIFGTGYVHTWSEGGEIKAERVFPPEIIVDEHEAKHGKPRQIFRHKDGVDVEALCAQWPEHEEGIRNSKLLGEEYRDPQRVSRQVSVISAIRLPSHPDADDGRYVVCTSDAVLIDRPWKRMGFPYTEFRLSTPELGWHGVGYAEELLPIQIEINYLLQKIQELMNLATSQIWIKKGSGVNKSTLGNKNWGIHEYKDQPPIHMAVQSVSGEYLQWVMQLVEQAYASSGVSQFAANSQVPAGLKSGEAIRRYNDTVSQRGQHISQNYDQFYLDWADVLLEEASEIAASGDGGLSVLVQDDKRVERINFKDVAIKRNNYVMRVFPASLLPDTPSGKLETIQELSQAVPDIQRYLIHLLDIPDIDNIRSLLTAPIELVDNQLEAIIERGEFETPLPFMDLEIARHRGTLTLNRAVVDKVPEERLELLRRWLSRVDMLQQPPPQPAQPVPEVPQQQGM